MGVSGVCLLLVVAGLCCSPAFAYDRWTRQTTGNDAVCDPTPTTLQNSFMTTCTRMNINSSECTRAWMAFSGAFARKDPAMVMESDYANYFEVLPIEVGPSQNLFWSGVQELAGMVSCMCPTGANVVSSTNTPSSAIFNSIGNVNWCGTTSTSSQDGIDYSNGCLCSVTAAFWGQFSTEFALSARGTAFYLGYGEKKGGTFQSTSFFARKELPNLNPPKVSNVVAMVVTNLTGESCRNGTVLTLENAINARSLKFSCYNIFGDPTDRSQWQALSVCASKIITAEQNGNSPTADDCFAVVVRAGAGVTLPQIFALIGGLLFAVVLNI